MHTILGLSFVTLLVVHSPAQDRPTDEDALRGMWDRFEAAFNAGDAQAVARLYAPDADRINPAGEVARGRAAIRSQYEAVFALRKAASLGPLHASIEIRLLRPDVAILDGKWEEMRLGQTVRGKFTVIATKEDGEWQMAAGRDQGLIQPGFDLELMSNVNGVSDIPTEGRNRVILADVKGVLHFRVFDADRRRIVDTDETQLPDKKAQIAELRSFLRSLWSQPQISPSDKAKVIAAVTSIVVNHILQP